MTPQNVTPSSLLMQLPGLLGLNMNDPSMAQVGQLLLNWLKSQVIEPYTGIKASDPMWNATLYSNMTNFGIMMQNMNTAANINGFSNMAQMQASARYQFYQGVQRTLTSEADFNKLVAAGQTGGFKDYDAFIEHKTQGMMDNGLLTMAMNNGQWDPTGKMMAAYNMKEASANVAREAMWRGEKNWQDKSDAVGRMFLNDRLELDYDKSKYGMMTLNETTALAAILTKNQPFASGAKSENEIKAATERLRTKMQNLTKAMSPLKDFFGDDVPNMVRFLEEVAGKSINQMDSQTVANITRDMTNGVLTGSFTLNQVQKMTTQMQAGFGQMNTPYYMDMAANVTSRRILEAVNDGVTPPGMSRESYSRLTADRQMRMAAAPLTNNFNLAYSVFEARMRQRGVTDVDATMEAFKTRFNDLRENRKMGTEQALLEITGASDVLQMAEMGKRGGGYFRAQAAGLGLDMDITEGLKKRSRNFIRWGLDDRQREARRSIFNDYLTSNLSLEELDRKYQDMEFSKDEKEKAQFREWNYLQSDKQFMNFNADLRANVSQRRAAEKNAQANKRRERTNALERIFESAMEHEDTLAGAITNLFINNGKGFNLQDIKDKYSNMPAVVELAEKLDLSKEDMERLASVTEAARLTTTGTDLDKNKGGLKAARAYLTAIDSDPEKKKLLDPLIGRFNLTKDKDKKAATARVLNIASSMSTQTLSALLKDDKTGMDLVGIAQKAEADYAKFSRVAPTVNADWFAKDENGKEFNAKDVYWRDWRAHTGDKDFAEQLQAHYETYKKAGPEVAVKRAIEASYMKKLLAGGTSTEVDTAVSQARKIISNFTGSDEAKRLLESYNTDVILGHTSANDWSTKNLKGLDVEGQTAVIEQLNRVSSSINSAMASAEGVPQISQQEAQSSLLDKISGFLGSLDTTMKQLNEWLGITPSSAAPKAGAKA